MRLSITLNEDEDEEYISYIKNLDRDEMGRLRNYLVSSTVEFIEGLKEIEQLNFEKKELEKRQADCAHDYSAKTREDWDDEVGHFYIHYLSCEKCGKEKNVM